MLNYAKFLDFDSLIRPMERGVGWEGRVGVGEKEKELVSVCSQLVRQMYIN